jgi:hypothetical protein
MQACIPILLVLIMGCSARISTDNFTSSNTSYTRVTIHDLLNYKAFYHLKPVAVEERYTCGFEKSDIKPLVKFPFDSNIKYYDWSQAIWVDTRFDKKRVSCDSLNEREVIIRGIFDTTRHGHLDDYVAAITNAFVSLKADEKNE